MKRHQLPSVVLLSVMLQTVLSAQSPDKPAAEPMLDIEYARLHDRARRFAEETEQYHFAGILWGKILYGTAKDLLTNPPEGKLQQLRARNQVLQPLAKTAKRLMTKSSPRQLEEVRRTYDKWANAELEHLKLSELEQAKLKASYPEGYGRAYPLACHYIRNGEFEQGYGWMYLLLHINPYSKLPEKDVKAWLDAAERGIEDPELGKQAVKKLPRPSRDSQGKKDR